MRKRHRHRPSLSLRSSSTPWSRPSRKRWPTNCRAQGTLAHGRTRPMPAGADPAIASNADEARLLGTFRASTEPGHRRPAAGERCHEGACRGRWTRARPADEAPASFLAALLAAVVAALAVEAIVRALLARPKNRLAPNAVPEKGMRSLAYLGLLALFDGLAVIGLLLASEFALGAVFPGARAATHTSPRRRSSFLLLWRVNALVLRLIFSPDLPAARLCEIDDDAGRHLYRSIVGIDAPLHLPSFSRRAGGARQPVRRRHCRVTPYHQPDRAGVAHLAGRHSEAACPAMAGGPGANAHVTRHSSAVTGWALPFPSSSRSLRRRSMAPSPATSTCRPRWC